MRTVHLQTIHASVATTRCHTQGGPQVNKFVEVSSVGHQMSVAGGRSQVCLGEGVGPRSDVWE